MGLPAGCLAAASSHAAVSAPASLCGPGVCARRGSHASSQVFDKCGHRQSTLAIRSRPFISRGGSPMHAWACVGACGPWARRGATIEHAPSPTSDRRGLGAPVASHEREAAHAWAPRSAFCPPHVPAPSRVSTPCTPWISPGFLWNRVARAVRAECVSAVIWRWCHARRSPVTSRRGPNSLVPVRCALGLALSID